MTFYFFSIRVPYCHAYIDKFLKLFSYHEKKLKKHFWIAPYLFNKELGNPDCI